MQFSAAFSSPFCFVVLRVTWFHVMAAKNPRVRVYIWKASKGSCLCCCIGNYWWLFGSPAPVLAKELQLSINWLANTATFEEMLMFLVKNSQEMKPLHTLQPSEDSCL